MVVVVAALFYHPLRRFRLVFVSVPVPPMDGVRARWPWRCLRLLSIAAAAVERVVLPLLLAVLLLVVVLVVVLVLVVVVLVVLLAVHVVALGVLPECHLSQRHHCRYHWHRLSRPNHPLPTTKCLQLSFHSLLPPLLLSPLPLPPLPLPP